MLSSRSAILLVVLTIITWLTLPAQSAVRYVKADSPGPTLDGTSWNNAFHTVTAALTAALSGDEIWVAKGTYVERITLKKVVALYGGFVGAETSRDERNWTTNKTILDGNQAGNVVTADYGPVSSARIDGFTIRRSAYNCAGIYCYRCSPTISNNTITLNAGDGIDCYYSSSAISNNIITSNRDDGISMVCSSPTIANNTIASNAFDGMSIIDSAPDVSNNIVAFNFYGISGYGELPTPKCNCVYGNTSRNYSGLLPSGSDISIDPLFTDREGRDYHLMPESPCFDAGDNSTVSGGSTDMDGQKRIMGVHVDIGAYELDPSGSVVPRPVFDIGGAVFTGPISVVVSCSDPDAVIHYTTNGNQPTDSDPIIASGTPMPVVENTVLKARAYKMGMIPSGVATASYRFKVATPTFEPDGGTYADTQCVKISCSTPDVTIHYTTTGIMPTEEDPIVASGSEIEVNRSLPLMAMAFKANWNTSNNKSAAYFIPGRTIICVKPDGNDSNDGMSWEHAKKTVQCAINASVAGVEIWVAAGTYTENIGLKNGVALYGGFAGTETSRNERDWTRNQAVLDGNRAGCVVTAVFGVGSSTRIDGFTIRNGNGNCGGIYSRGSLTISNNTITSNIGSGIDCANGTATIANNIITSNTAVYGGGISSWSSAYISNNTIVSNKADYGGGIYCSGSTAISNNMVAFNSSGICRSSGTAALRNNNVYGNTSYNYSGLTAGTGDISVDPLFVNRSGGDYHLFSTSPCINAGWNDALGLSSTDMDGQNRILGGVIDIGADEYQPAGDLTSISGAKKVAMGNWIEFTGDIVTARMGDAFYIETENRSSGIRVEKPAHTLNRSMKAHVFGKVKTNTDGEVYIEASLAEQKGSETGTIAPLAITNRSLGGSTLGLQAGITEGSGLSNIGLLVRTCGRIVEIEQASTPSWFRIDDGSGVSVKCIISAGVTIDPSWERVSVTGISSCEKVGDDMHRLVRVRDQADIAPY